MEHLGAWEHEFDAGPLVAVDKADIASVPAGDPPADGQTRADAWIGVLPVQAVEHSERLFAKGRLDSRAVVRDPQTPVTPYPSSQPL